MSYKLVAINASVIRENFGKTLIPIILSLSDRVIARCEWLEIQLFGGFTEVIHYKQRYLVMQMQTYQAAMKREGTDAKAVNPINVRVLDPKMNNDIALIDKFKPE